MSEDDGGRETLVPTGDAGGGTVFDLGGAIFDTSPVGIAIIDAAGEIVRANTAFAEICGRDAASLGGITLIELIDAGAEPLPRDRTDTRATETRFVRPDGTRRWGEVHVRDAPATGNGAAARLAVHVIDITERKAAEESARQTVEQYRLAASVTRGAMYDYDIDTLELSFSEGMNDYFGYAAAEARSLDWWHEHIHPEDGARVRQALREAAGSDGFAAEYRFLRADGTYADVLDRSIIIRGTDGKPTRAVGIVADVSEQKHAEQTLRQAADVFHATASSFGGVIYDWDLRTDANYRFGAMAGGKIVPGEGERPLAWWEDGIHPDDRARTLEGVQDVVSGKTPNFVAEYRFHADDGSYRVIWDHGTVLRDENGAPTRFVGSMIDVTEHKETEARNRDTELRYAALVEQLPAYIADADEEGAAVFVSPKTRHLMGFRPNEQVDAKAWLSMLHEDDRERIGREMARTDREFVDSEYRLRRRDGRVIWVHDEATVVRDEDGKPRFIQGVLFDITERRRQEHALAEANERLQASVAELEVWGNEISLLSELGEVLQASLNETEAHAIIGSFGPQLFPSYDGAVGITRASRDIVEVASSWGDTGFGTYFGPNDCWALRRGRIHAVAGATAPFRCAHVGDSTPFGYLCVPMMAKGEAVGVMSLVARESGGDAVRVQRLALAVAEHAAVSLTNLKLHETLRLQSIRDPLTGLFNRRYMEESLARELSRCARASQPLAVLMLDIDRFKEFNDSFGHEAGDSVLRRVGEYLRAKTRNEDIACRYGGEELTVILPETTLDQAVVRATELLGGIRKLELRSREQALAPITVSAGVSAFPVHGQTGDELLRLADQALYRAKASGKDRVEIADAALVMGEGNA